MNNITAFVLLCSTFLPLGAFAQINSDIPGLDYLSAPLNQEESNRFFAGNNPKRNARTVRAINRQLSKIDQIVSPEQAENVLSPEGLESFSGHFPSAEEDLDFWQDFVKLVAHRLRQLPYVTLEKDLELLQKQLNLSEVQLSSVKKMLQPGQEQKYALLLSETKSTSAQRGQIDGHFYRQVYSALALGDEDILRFEKARLLPDTDSYSASPSSSQDALNRLIEETRFAAYFTGMSEDQARQADRVIDDFAKTGGRSGSAYFRAAIRNIVELLDFSQIEKLREWPARKPYLKEIALEPQPVELYVDVDEVNPELKADSTFASFSDAEQQVLLTEAMEVFDKCVGKKSYATYHDCECLKEKFVHARMADTDTHQNFLLSRLSKSCPNIPGIKTMAFNGCENISISKDQPEGFCACVADSVAEQYAAKPIARIQIYQKYLNRAFGQCKQ